jgi:hypothetical protein
VEATEQAEATEQTEATEQAEAERIAQEAEISRVAAAETAMHSEGAPKDTTDRVPAPAAAVAHPAWVLGEEVAAPVVAAVVVGGAGNWLDRGKEIRGAQT